MRRERGVTVPLTAAFIFALLAMAALAIDIGIAYTARASVQHAADAAALAGAFTFVNQQNASDPAQAASQDAAAVANTNFVLGKQIGSSPNPVDGTAAAMAPCTDLSDNTVCVDAANHRVTVKVMVPLGTYFASIWPSFGLLTIRAAATAEAGAGATGSHCMKPLYIPNTAMAPANNDGDGGDGGNNSISNACSRKLTFFDPITLQPTAWAQSQVGTTFTISPVGSGNGDDGDHNNGIAPNQYYPLNFGNGTAGFKCGIQHCINDPQCTGAIDPSLFNNSVAGCSSPSSLTTMVNVDPKITRDAFKQLQGQPGDKFFGVGNYGQDVSSLSDTSNSVVTLPVWNNCDPNTPIVNSVKNYPPSGMVQLFLDQPDSNGNIRAHLVGFANCDNNGSGTGPGGIPVRLVHTID